MQIPGAAFTEILILEVLGSASPHPQVLRMVLMSILWILRTCIWGRLIFSEEEKKKKFQNDKTTKDALAIVQTCILGSLPLRKYSYPI